MQDEKLKEMLNESRAIRKEAEEYIQKSRELLAETDALIEEGKKYLEMNGVRYDLRHWVTIKEYARRHGLEGTNVVTNWIKRGIIPAENVFVVSELNDLKLIRDIEYKKARN